jgi:osmoprotectant transport system substrate-binding protein
VEERILGSLTELTLSSAGVALESTTGLAPEVLRDQLLKGEIDLCWEYTGRALVVYQRNPDREILSSPQDCYQTVREVDEPLGLVWGAMAPGNNSYGVVMKAETAQKYGVSTISELSELAAQMVKDILAKRSEKKMILGLDEEFLDRPDGYRALVARYGVDFGSYHLVKMKPEELLDNLRTGQVDAVVGPLVDGRIIRFKLTSLKEDKAFFPAYNPAPVWRKEALARHSKAAKALDSLAASLDLAALNKLRFPVEIHGRPPKESARKWLLSQGRPVP